MIDNDAMLVKDAGIAWHKRGLAEGRAGCRATHGAIYHQGYTRAMEEWAAAGDEAGYARGEARGRVQGAVVVGLLVMAAVWWRRR